MCLPASLRESIFVLPKTTASSIPPFPPILTPLFPLPHPPFPPYPLSSHRNVHVTTLSQDYEHKAVFCSDTDHDLLSSCSSSAEDRCCRPCKDAGTAPEHAHGKGPAVAG